MGLLALGTPYNWAEAKPNADYVREHGINQFLKIWNRLKDKTGDVLLWGDEIEYVVISYDEENKNARLSLRQEEILSGLQADALARTAETPGRSACIPVFHPEYGRYMLESTPGEPYGATIEDLLSVEGNMKFRRKLAKARLHPHEVPLTLTNFPRLGAPGIFTDPYYEPGGPVARSLFLPDEITNRHVRFPTLTTNIRERRGAKVAINMPIFFDKNTPKPFIDSTIPLNRNKWPQDSEASLGAALPNSIYMDAMGFGMGCCCLQITFQACSVSEARRMYDAFIPVGPIMLALSAASPIFRGLLSDVDCRWDVIAGSVDDRTQEERGLKPLEKDRFVIPKSRYDSCDLYIYNDAANRSEYNDTNPPIDLKIKERLMEEGGLDELLANHFAHLFIRDPIVIFEESLVQDDETSSDHFENIQSTNWQTVRFKPPPPASDIGWRVEFRSMEVQLTDYENAAFSVFIVLLTRAIMNLGLNFYIPISKVDENMNRAHVRDAVNNQKFWFRRNLFDPSPGVGCDGNESSGSCSAHGDSRAPSPNSNEKLGPVEEEFGEFSIDEIINGKESENFIGLLGVIHMYLDSLKLCSKTLNQLNKSLDLIKRRANGSLLTTATWIRKFIDSHPKYKHDSIITEEINYDLIKAIDQIEKGIRKEPSLLPESYQGSDFIEGDEFQICCGDVMGSVRI